MTLFGLTEDTRIATPDGPRALSALAVGDPVWAWSLAQGALVARPVRAVHESLGEHLYVLVSAGARLDGCTPGVQVFDAFEDMFRGSGSLSSLTELLVLQEGEASVQPLQDAFEVVRPGARLRYLTLEGEEGAFFASGILVKHEVMS